MIIDDQTIIIGFNVKIEKIAKTKFVDTNLFIGKNLPLLVENVTNHVNKID